jgi:hypothetical protein
MRRLMNFIVSIGLIGAGLYALYEELFVRYSGIHGRYQPFGVGLVLIGSGVVWLWFYVVGDIVLTRRMPCGTWRPEGLGLGRTEYGLERKFVIF